ncbi:MAG: right-handed parallel beta-helix repeat-containing protein [bacterium]|nr:right-handed parallel beta-helix repeat-containing protein [bacterium]
MSTGLWQWVSMVFLWVSLTVVARADSTFVLSGNVEGNWSLATSPYVVQGNITVLATDSLTIEPGVRVYFTGAYSLGISGYFGVGGTPNDSVVFTTDTLLNPSRWRGLSLSNANDSSYIRYAVIENASSAGTFVTGGTTLRLEHCSFYRNKAELAGGAMYVTASTLLMDSCYFERNASRTEGGAMYIHNNIGTIISDTRAFKNVSTNGSGGGAYVRGASPMLVHCTFDSNYARVNGGGIMFKNCTARIDSSIMRANNARGHGGGIACENSSPLIYDCTVEANYTTDFDGGGVYVWGDCIVRQNTAGLYGAGVFLRNNAHPTFTNCDFDSNTSLGNGGGLSIRQSQPTLTNCRIRRNTADAEGGGVHLWEAADATFFSCEISNNSSDLNGGGISTNQSTLNAANCLITKNQTAALGGGLATTNSSKIYLQHCTIGGSVNGGMRLESTVADIENSIVALSLGDNLYFDAAVASRIAYSLLQGNIQYAGNDPTNGPTLLGSIVAVNANGDSCDTYFNLFVDPQFEDAASGNWNLTFGSPAVGAGNWNSLTEDLSGAIRPQPAMTLPDMGALESADGFSPDGLFGPLSGSIGPNTIKVVADVVVDSPNTLTIVPGTTLMFCGPSGLDVTGVVNALGAFTDSIVFATDTVTNPGRWRGVTMSGNSGNSEFEYCSISDSRALTTKRTEGGAIRMASVSPSFSNCSIERHQALQGGAVFLEQSSPTFTNCYFEAGAADSGGVICARSGSAPIFDGCTIKSGMATAGGGYLAQGATGQLLNCRIENNSSFSTGGAVFLDAAPAIIRNNLFLNNTSTTGGAIWIGSTSATVEFNTIAGNTAIDGAGIYMRFGSTQVKNNIIAENHGDGIYFFVAPTAAIRYNCVASNDSASFAFFSNSPSQGPVGLGALDSLNANGDPCDRYRNIQLNPLWVSGVGHDYYLAHIATGQAEDSPCLNAADPAAITPTGTTSTNYATDNLVADQGYHGPQLSGPPNPVTDLVIRAAADSVRLFWSYAGTGLFLVKTDSVDTGSFLTTVAATTDTFAVLPYATPIHSTRGYFHVIVEH